MRDDISARVLYEDNHLIAINKLASEIVQGDESEDEPLSDVVKRFLKKKYDKPGNVYLGIPHRLDRPTSGVVVYTKTQKALSRMSQLFKTRDVKKTYWAVVDRMPPHPAGELKHYLIRDRKKNRSRAYDTEKKNSQFAHLSYRLVGATQNYYLLEIDLHTGRHHQIRAQLAAIGCCIKGDLKYGAKRSNRGGGIYLHARQISFTHPVTSERVTITAPVPIDPLWSCFERR